MALCATARCGAPAGYLHTGRGTGEHTYRARHTCHQHRAASRRWVQQAGPVHETDLATGKTTQPAPARDDDARPALF